MTIVPPPVEDTAMRAWENPEEQPEPDDRWGKYVPGEPQLRAAAFGTLIGLLVAVLMGAAYGAEPGDSLWALNKTVFTGHSQDVAIRAEHGRPPSMHTIRAVRNCGHGSPAV